MSGTKGHSGGKREGAGRKHLPPGRGTVHRTVTLSPDADAIIRAHICAGDSYASTLDRIVREWAERPSE